MTGERYQDLPAAKRRRLAFRAVLRDVLAAAVLVVLYYVLPLDRSWDSDTAIRLLIGILVFARPRARVIVWRGGDGQHDAADTCGGRAGANNDRPSVRAVRDGDATSIKTPSAGARREERPWSLTSS